MEEEEEVEEEEGGGGGGGGQEEGGGQEGGERGGGVGGGGGGGGGVLYAMHMFRVVCHTLNVQIILVPTLKWSCDVVQIFGATIFQKIVILYHKRMNERYRNEFTTNKVGRMHKTIYKP